MTETPFKINVSEEQITLLHKKLELATFPDELDEAGWAYGSPLSDIRRLVDHWKTGYNWRQHEAALNNELPQFTRDIEVEDFGALNVHYVHKKSEAADAIPLLFVHGWPGSFLEVRKILPLLVETSPQHPSFHVVALSLPGFGFSQAPSRQGFQLTQYAELANKLMLALGYSEYVTQGGDWGYWITEVIAKHYGPKHSKAWHTNFPQGEPPHPIKNPLSSLYYLVKGLSTSEKEGLKHTQNFLSNGIAYLKLQATKPQTLGYGLADSPVGLLAWIYEKLVSWSDSYPWTDDEVLTWISIYQFSRAGPAASVRIYYEVISRDGVNEDPRSMIPHGISRFPREIEVYPRGWTLSRGNVVFDSEHDSGGHFAAHEKPQELVGDLRKMFGRGGPAFEVVKGPTGYAKL